MEQLIIIYKKYFGYALFFSMFINCLQLTFSIYMLQVYDKVLTSYNLPTLVVITITALIALFTLGLLEWIRSRLLIRGGVELDKQLSEKTLTYELTHSTDFQVNKDSAKIRDVQILRNFLGGNAVFSFFDIPWMPLYFLLIFILHPALGLVSVIGGVLIFLIAFLTQQTTKPHLTKANKVNQQATTLLTIAHRNSLVTNSMGMMENITKRWLDLNEQVTYYQMKGSLTAGGLQAISKSFRLTIQVLIYAIGAYLVINQQASAGVMIAASIIMGRALAPVDQAMSTYKQSSEAWSAYKRLKSLVSIIDSPTTMQLPKPIGNLTASSLSLTLNERKILQNINFTLKTGTILAVLGPSGSGKSTLCKLLLGVWSPTSGKVCLDSAELSFWKKSDLGKYIGYLPQDVELYNGTIAENIARMGTPNSDEVIKVAKLIGIHELILSLPKGYDTYIGDNGQGLSGGQRQRIGIARAIYNDPCIIILDEPNSNLDEEGDLRLNQCLEYFKKAEKTVIVITHKPSILSSVDDVMVIVGGQITIHGQRNAVLKKMSELHEQRLSAQKNYTSKTQEV